jgi:hypothetical protein
MAATFPFVILYQILAAPFVAGILVAAWGLWRLWRLLDPSASTTTENPYVIGISIGVASLSFGIMLATSLTGFYEGWRAGWSCARGRRFQEVMWEGPIARRLRQLLRVSRATLHGSAKTTTP